MIDAYIELINTFGRETAKAIAKYIDNPTIENYKALVALLDIKKAKAIADYLKKE